MARYRYRVSSILFGCLAAVFTISIFVGLCPIQDKRCDSELKTREDANLLDHLIKEAHRQHLESEQQQAYLRLGDDPAWGPHKLCLIVPYRNRFEELLEFAPHMHRFLNAQKVRHKIYVINQVDSLRFNRAALINAGFRITESECDYIGMHDVDLIPANMKLNYSYPADGPYHVAAPDLHPKYHYKTFVGGILLINNKHFKQVNGLSNRFWGWGREDDEFYARMKEAHLTIFRPSNITTGYDTFKHIHDRATRPRDYKRYGRQKDAGRRRDRVTGLDTVQYEIPAMTDIVVEDAPVTIVQVELFCDLEETPWCVHPDQLDSMLADVQRSHQQAQEQVKVAQDQMKEAEHQIKTAQESLQSANNRIRPLQMNHEEAQEDKAVNARNEEMGDVGIVGNSDPHANHEYDDKQKGYEVKKPQKVPNRQQSWLHGSNHKVAQKVQLR